MGQAFNQLFAALFMLFSAAEKGASTLNNLATWGDESSAVFVDEARHSRKEKLKKQQAEAAASAKALASPASAPAIPE